MALRPSGQPAPGVSPGSVSWLEYQEDGFVNSRGSNIFTHSWVNKSKPIRDLVFFQHGFGDHSNDHIAEIAMVMAEEGYGCFALDCEGCGYSTGERMFVTKVEHYCEDLMYYRDLVMARHPSSRAFLYGESMGGCIAVVSSLMRPKVWAGMLLIAPMIRIADDAKPPSWQVPILKALAYIAPKWAAIPAKDFLPLVFKQAEDIEKARLDHLRYTGKTRLGTGFALLMATEQLGPRLPQLADPFIVFHGTGDLMTDPSSSRRLFAQASSADKEAIYYEGFYHALNSEPNGGKERFIRDCLSWLNERSGTEPAHPPGTERARERYVLADLTEGDAFLIPNRDVVPVS